jgi:hypothetical protein
MKRIASLLMALALAGCGSTQQAAQSAQSKWLGKSVDEFFSKNGPPKRQFVTATGGVIYTWETLAMPSGTRTQLVCSADIVSDSGRTIREIRLQEDSIGHWNTSRCAEIFG